MVAVLAMASDEMTTAAADISASMGCQIRPLVAALGGVLVPSSQNKRQREMGRTSKFASRNGAALGPWPLSNSDCKLCGELGSVALVSVYGKSLNAKGEKELIMVVDTSGYELLSFSLGSKWVVTKLNGESVEIDFDEDIVCTDEARNVDENTSKMKYSLRKIKKADLS
uniref:Uncharacterized protein n=1 Tax=Oryza punctata TaxID=4537 RepID=A0A0E0KPF0_ORYPU